MFDEPLCIMYTSSSLTLTPIWTEVSPLLNFFKVQGAGSTPNLSQTNWPNSGCDDPTKILHLRISIIGDNVAEIYVFGFDLDETAHQNERSTFEMRFLKVSIFFFLHLYTQPIRLWRSCN